VLIEGRKITVVGFVEIQPCPKLDSNRVEEMTMDTSSESRRRIGGFVPRRSRSPTTSTPEVSGLGDVDDTYPAAKHPRSECLLFSSEIGIASG
jgi:hypothetical protein